MRSAGIWLDDLDMLTIDGVSRFEYYWEFFKRHTTGDNDIFVIDWRERFWHASFVDPGISVSKFKNQLIYESTGIKIMQRRVLGETYEADGSLPIEFIDGGDAEPAFPDIYDGGGA